MEQSNALMVVETLAEKLGAAESLLEAGYAQFADALLVVQDGRFWQPAFPSWGKYLASITDKYKMGQRQLYHKVAVVKELRGSVSTEDLTLMGVSKASILARAHQNGATLTQDMVENAKKPEVSAKDLKKAIAELLHTPEDEATGWIDLDYSFYVTDEEKAEIREAERIARTLDPPISTSLQDFMQRKEIMLRLCREFISSYPAPENVLDNKTNSC